jgi:hypothetical protein
MKTIAFDEFSKLKAIGALAFAGCKLDSITIPASTEKIDGSAFLGRRLAAIQVTAGSQNFSVDGNMLITSNGREIVRYFGLDDEVVVPADVEILGKSCFEYCCHVESIIFENGSKLRLIGCSAFCRCTSLSSIEIPASIEIIEDEAFNGCIQREYCLLDDRASLVTIGKAAFAECSSLTSLDIPMMVESIGYNCFKDCSPLSRLTFASANSLRKVVGDMSLDMAFEHFGFNDLSCLFSIEVTEETIDLDFLKWYSVVRADSHLKISRAI